MKKIFLIVMILFVFVLAGCSDLVEANGLKVVSKDSMNNLRSVSYYIVVVNQNGEKGRFEVSHSDYDSLEKDVVINVKYDESLFVRNITFFSK